MHRTLNENLGSILPSDLQRAVLNGIFSIGRMQLSGSILNENNPLGSSRLSKLRQIFEEGKSLQLQFPAEDLGFRYQYQNAASEFFYFGIKTLIDAVVNLSISDLV